MDQHVEPPTIPPSSESASPNEVPLRGVPTAPASGSPLSEAAQTFQPHAATNTVDPKSKKMFFVLLVLWLIAWPLATVVQLIYRLALTSPGSDPSAMGIVVNILALLFGLLGLLGWIPVVIVGVMTWGNKK